jgi:two-component system, NarL family, response regulator DesR
VWRSDTPETPEPRGVRVLVADDEEGVRSLFAALLRQAAGVSSVLEVEDGADAVRVGQEAGVQVAVLDLNMPRVDGLEAALKLAALQPSIGLALHSSDLRTLRKRASGVGIALFERYEFGSLVAWVERRRAA